MLPPERDPLGVAALTYFRTGDLTPVRVESDIAEEDCIPVEYLFRSLAEMPEIEKKALDLCRGSVLDVGAAAGCHSLVLQARGVDVSALEISDSCCRLMQERGVKQIIHNDYYSYDEARYDVLLFLMNGIGLAGSLPGLTKFLDKGKELLNPGGMILFDSSDIEYLFREEDGSLLVDLNREYYGELKYRMYYREIMSNEFPWLFVDFETLKTIAEGKGFEATLLAEGAHYDYLGMLKKKNR